MMDLVFGEVAGEENRRGGELLRQLRPGRDRSIDLVLDALGASARPTTPSCSSPLTTATSSPPTACARRGNLVYDENFHVPLIIDHPDLAGGTTTDAPRRRSTPPTLLEFAAWTPPGWPSATRPCTATVGVRADGGASGRDGVLTAVRRSPPRRRLCTTSAIPTWPTRCCCPAGPPRLAQAGLPCGVHRRALHVRPLLLTPSTRNRRLVDLDAPYAENDVVLYDRQTDPGETVNLADDPPTGTWPRPPRQLEDASSPPRSVRIATTGSASAPSLGWPTGGRRRLTVPVPRRSTLGPASHPEVFVP